MTKPTLAFATLFAASALPATAHAWIYSGNPGDLEFRVDRPEGDVIDGSVLVDKLRIHRCNGTYVDYDIEAWVDPVKGHTVHGSITGDLCQATWYLSSTMVVAGQGWVVQTNTPTLVVDLDPFDHRFDLPGAYVKSGSFSGNPLEVYSDY